MGGDKVFLNAAWMRPFGTLTGFAYLVDLDEAPVQNFRLSSQTYGMRLAGTRAIGAQTRLGYTATIARQSDYGRNPNESLGADDGRPFASFQTPLSSGVKFLGLIGRFLPTPPDGVRDFNVTAAHSFKSAGPLQNLRFQAVLRHFTSDRNTRVYGNEVDLLASAKWGRTALSLRYANYVSEGFGTDAQRLLAQIEWAF